ncbi:hypothetical protein EPI10_028974 [Gossypium australe]|uniref:Uncharacterized protein n=1 Tax=Gossypium australe TaxID=47621 RepID=A0A5B6V066_9ROSI|nr:hypothetical protein EPI10_028974 [Gossypium australe]
MEKKSNESFRQYAQRWREVAMQVQPPLLEKETTMLFINTLKAPFIIHMIGSTTKSFADIVMAGEMVENAIRGGKIEAGETTRRSAPRKKDNEVNNTSTYNKGYSKAITTSQPKVIMAGQQGSTKQEFGVSAENPLPNHGDKGINAIGGNVMRKIKEDIAEFHKAEGHEIEECVEFRILVQSLMDNKELKFYEEGLKGGNIYATEGELMKQKVNYPRIIISRPRNMEGGAQIAPKVIIQKPISFPYKDKKMVPWNYDYNVTIPGVERSVGTSEEVQNEGSYIRSRMRYDLGNIRVESVKSKTVTVEQEKGPEAPINETVKEEEAKEFLKFLKHIHREALMKVLNETYVTKDISVSKLDRMVSNISADNFIYFSDDEIPPGSMGSTKALHITTRCKGYTLPSVLIDNGSALNVLPLSMLKRLPIDRAVPSSLHQKLKLVTEGRLVTIKAEEDIIATVTNDVPYLEANEEATECSFRSLEFVNAKFILEGNQKREIEKEQERRRARLNGEEVKWESMTFPHISQTFVSGGIIHPERGLSENPHINAIHEEGTEQRNLLGIHPYEPRSVLDNWTTEELPVVFRDYTE